VDGFVVAVNWETLAEAVASLLCSPYITAAQLSCVVARRLLATCGCAQDALCEYLLEKPDLYRDETVLFLLDEFNTHITPSSIRRALKSRG
jgi:hypothetical protein